jgi:FixJ family two-component response regulator
MRFTTLTPREQEVARRVGQLKTAPEIAQELGIAEKTVRDYIWRIGRVVPGSGPPMRRIARWVKGELDLE